MAAPIHVKNNEYGAGDAQLYETQPGMVEALLAADPWFQEQPRLIMEPACGPGAITEVLQAYKHKVISSDINDYRHRWKGRREPGVEAPSWGVNFFDYSPSQLRDIIPDRSNFAILTNPPYGTGERGDVNKAARFAAHALQLAPRVYMLLELDFVQGGVQCPLRDQLLDTPTFTGLFPFRERCQMHRDGWEGPKSSQSRTHAWFRWERDPQRPRELTRLSRITRLPCVEGMFI